MIDPAQSNNIWDSITQGSQALADAYTNITGAIQSNAAPQGTPSGAAVNIPPGSYGVYPQAQANAGASSPLLSGVLAQLGMGAGAVTLLVLGIVLYVFLRR